MKIFLTLVLAYSCFGQIYPYRPPSPTRVISLVAHGQASGAISPTTSAINMVGANLLIVNCTWLTSAGSVVVTDSSSNTWIPLTSVVSSQGFSSRLFYAQSAITTSSQTFTASIGATNIFAALIVAGFSGALPSGTFDQQNSAMSFAAVTTQQPGSITPTGNGELIISNLGYNNATTPPTINSGFSILENVTFAGGVNYGASMAFLIQGTASPINPTWAFTSTTGPVATIASFK
jgi:hypothetical protein